MKKKETEEEKMNTELDISKFHCSNELMVDNLSKSSEKNRKKKTNKKKKPIYFFLLLLLFIFDIYNNLLKKKPKGRNRTKGTKKVVINKIN